VIAAVTRLWQDRTVRLGALAAIPPLWFAIAWVDVRVVLLAPACAAAATYVLRVRARREPEDDEPLCF
jgi:hypothetical protein